MGQSLPVSGDSSLLPTGIKAFFRSPAAAQQSLHGHTGHSSLFIIACSVPPTCRGPWAEQMPASEVDRQQSPQPWPGVALTRKSSALVSPQPQNRLRVYPAQAS